MQETRSKIIFQKVYANNSRRGVYTLHVRRGILVNALHALKISRIW